MALGVAYLAGAVLLAYLLLSAALGSFASGTLPRRAGKGLAVGCGVLLFPLAVIVVPLFFMG